MARVEPFRSLLEMAVVAEPRALQVAPVPAMEPPARPSLERRLDAIALAASTPPRGLRLPTLQPMVPLRLHAPDEQRRAPSPGAIRSAPLDVSRVAEAVDCADELRSDEFRADELRALDLPAVDLPALDLLHADLPELPSIPDGIPEGYAGDEELPALPDLDEETPGLLATSDFVLVDGGATAGTGSLPKPRVIALLDTGLADDAAAPDSSVSIRVALARLRDVTSEATPARPLPAFAGVPELPRRRTDKVLRLRDGSCPGIDVRAFSSRDVEDDVDLSIDDGFDDPDLIEDRQGRSPAALALAALSDDGEPVAAGRSEDFAELAAAFGLDGPVVVLRGSTPPVLPVDDDTADGDDVAEAVITEDDVIDAVAAVDHAHDDDAFDDDAHGFGDDVVTPPRGTPTLVAVRGNRDDAGAATAEPTRPALVAPGAVRFVVEDAPARPRHEALSAEEVARNRLRARELYLVAVDDLGDGDVAGAVGHLQLAVAYDDRTSLYQDLLDQLTRRLQRAS